MTVNLILGLLVVVILSIVVLFFGWWAIYHLQFLARFTALYVPLCALAVYFQR